MNEKERSDLINKCIDESLKTCYLLSKKNREMLESKTNDDGWYWAIVTFSIILFALSLWKVFLN